MQFGAPVAILNIVALYDCCAICVCQSDESFSARKSQARERIAHLRSQFIFEPSSTLLFNCIAESVPVGNAASSTSAQASLRILLWQGE